MAEAGADAAVLTAPASLAWLFNIRGGDVIRTPLPLGQAIVLCPPFIATEAQIGAMFDKLETALKKVFKEVA